MHRLLLQISYKPLRKYYSSFSQPAFTSFFFRNAQWISNQHTQLQCSKARQEAIQIPAVFKPVEKLTPTRLLTLYAQLAKSRLTVLVVLSAMSSIAVSPLPTTLPVLLSTAVGTALCSASANTLNQIQEVPFDAQMARTRNRPLVRRAITPMHAVGFALSTGVAGAALLWAMVNPITAILGISNIALYSAVYTWMKRKTVENTWVGSVVGGIPPLMGWTACGGHILPTTTNLKIFLPPFLIDGETLPLDVTSIDNPLSALALFLLLYSWQFPHFNSLSYIVRESYAQASFRMLTIFDPTKNAFVSFRHSAVLAVVCSVLIPVSGLTTWMFSLTSFLPNLVLVRAAYRFWRKGGEKEARILWKHSLWYLPAMLGLMMFHKQSMEWLAWLGFSKEHFKESKNKQTLT